jgi:ABC-type spermidine/putrescine transport system permease subunit I
MQSFFFALTATIGTFFIGYPVAYFITFYTQKCKIFLLFLLTLPFWTNFVVQAYSWFFILEKEGLLNSFLIYTGIIDVPLTFMYTIGAIVFIMVYCYLPFMVIPICNSLEKIENRLFEASMDLGATRWETFKYIIFPLSLKGVQTGMILVFIPAFGEFVIPSLIGGSKYLSVGSLISYYYIEIYNQTMGATFTVMSCCILMGIAFLSYLLLIPAKQSKEGEDE